MTHAPEPAFSDPWHAHVFAMTVHLHETGLFSWPDWAARLGASLAAHGMSKDLDGGDDYFMAWLAALEALLADIEAAHPEDIAAMRTRWEAAYLSTPHGAPVRLSDDP